MCQGTDGTLGCLGRSLGGKESSVGRVPIGHSKDFDFISGDGKPLEVFMQPSDVI